jgi:hypothetical protein
MGLPEAEILKHPRMRRRTPCNGRNFLVPIGILVSWNLESCAKTQIFSKESVESGGYAI